MWWRGLTATAVLWGGGIVTLRAVVVPGEVCEPVEVTETRAAAVAAADWIDRGQYSDGSYLYEYNRDTDERINLGYNIVRHAGVTMSLYQMAFEGEGIYLAPADEGLGWMEERLERREDWAAIADNSGDLRLGANALMLAGLVFRRDATDEASRDDLMREIGRFLVRLQQPDGSFVDRWRQGDDGPYLELKSKYATGEAFWALAMMHNRFPGEGWDEPAIKVADYLSLYRDELEGFEFPPWADQWAAYGLHEMVDWPLSDDNITYARSLADRFGFLIRTEAQRSDADWYEFVHGRKTRAAGMGTWVEGLNSLWVIASNDERMADMEGEIGDRIACGTAMLAERQEPAGTGGAGATIDGGRDAISGGWFTEGVTRMDDQQHAISALLDAEAALRAREGDE
ncbi:MAG: hypothetical protein WD557_10665 [Dehalococcoidia bacterium]